MADPNRAFRQLQRMLNVDGQGRSYSQPRDLREDEYEVIAVIVYDTKKQEVRVEAPPEKAVKPPDSKPPE